MKPQSLRRTTVERGYGKDHKTERERWRPAVEAGDTECAEIICLEPHRWIAPDADWDLAHDRANGGWLGPAHARCNRAEGGRHAQSGLDGGWHSRDW